MLNDKDIEKLSGVFATKEDIKNFATKGDVTQFKHEILGGQDKILEKLVILLDEKTVRDDQDKRQKKVMEIHNKSLKRNKILLAEETLTIDKLRVF